jgi:hypothetical protein
MPVKVERIKPKEKAVEVARMRNDRTLYRRPKKEEGKLGRTPKYGEKFKFNEEKSVGEAEEIIEFWDDKHGLVRIENGRDVIKQPNIGGQLSSQIGFGKRDYRRKVQS